MSAADFLREAEALRRLAGKEEREAIRRHDLRETFSEMHTRLNEQLRTDMVQVQQQLQRLRNDVFRFQDQLMDVKPSPDVIDSLKHSMTDIENSISVFKDTQHKSFEELLKDETTLWTEISAFQKKMEVWHLPVKAVGRVTHADRLSTERNLPPEVMALETFLQQMGGQNGGWDEYEHQSFLRVWTKHRGRPSYRQEAKLYLPNKSEEELRQHEEWHEELRRLQEHKREAVRRWRAAKQSEREQQRERRGEDQDTQTPEGEEERLKREERRREASERLEAWRNQKTRQREQERETQLREEIRQRRRAKEERRRQLELKIEVEAHVRQRKREEELRLLQEEERERAEREERHRLAADGIRRFQERDSLRLEEKLQEHQSKEEDQQERQRVLDRLKQKVEQHIRRDPTRLWRPTKVWQERSKDTGPSGAAPLLHFFHRAVPTWRQDL